MKLIKIKLGDVISLSNDTNDKGKYSLKDVKGISMQKKFIETKADMQGVSLNPYLLVKPNEFAYVPVTSRNGEKITLAHNTTDDTYIVSSSYVVFKIKNIELLDPYYLFMIFNRPEFDRYSRFNSWGSAREVFSWEDMCDIEIELPPISVQKKYASIYKSVVENKKKYEMGLDDLKLVCDAYIEKMRRELPSRQLNNFISLINNKYDCSTDKIMGISNTQDFIQPNSRMDGVDINKYYLVKPFEFAYSPIHINEGSIALNRSNEIYAISPIYQAFKTDVNHLDPEYLMLWFQRKEFVRYCWFHAFGSARDSFEWEQMCEIKIPIPAIQKQKEIAKLIKVYWMRKNVLLKLEKLIKNICPILIKGSIEEARKS